METITWKDRALAALHPIRLSFFQQNKRSINKKFPSWDIKDVNDMSPFMNKCVLVKLKAKLL